MSKIIFKIGDVVRLKSGGPTMTVTGVDTETYGTLQVFCKWFIDEKENANHYPPEALENAD